MNNLPAEVYQDIFYHLSRPDLQTCSFVCKRWNLLAVQVYSKELIINCRKTELAKIYLTSNHASAFFKNGYLARKLTFKTGFERQVELCRGRIWPINANRQRNFCFNQAEFLLLLYYFPNIEEIDLTESEDFTYISFLFFANLQYVKKITAFQFKSQSKVSVDYQEYFATCFRFCGTLTSLYFEYTKYTKYYSCDGVGILDMLSQFKSLKHIEFYNAYSDSMIMFHILELCPQLTELTFTTDFSDYEVGVQESSYQIIEPDAKLNKKLLRLNINLLSLSTDYTRYLTRYITDGLHTVNIRITSTGFYDCVEKVGMEDFLKLFRKLGQLNEASILFSQNNSSRSTRLTNESKRTIWLQAADAFKGDKKLLCTVKFCKSSSSQYHFRYNASDKRLVFAYVLEDITSYEFGNIVYDEGEDEDYEEIEDAYYDGREEAYYPGRDDDYPIYRSDEPLPESTVLINSISAIGPETIDRLEIDAGKVSDDFVMKLLKYVFINCKNLQYLKVSDYLQIQSRSNQTNEEFNDIKDNLKMVHFLSSAPNNKIFNIILEYIPDIEVLALGSHSKFNSNFDLTLFKSLKRCYIIIPKISGYNYEALNIKFEYTDGKKQRYYYDGTAKNTLVREDISRTIRLCRSLTFICKKSVGFTVCFGSNKSLLDFDIDKIQENRYRIPTCLT